MPFPARRAGVARGRRGDLPGLGGFHLLAQLLLELIERLLGRAELRLHRGLLGRDLRDHLLLLGLANLELAPLVVEVVGDDAQPLRGRVFTRLGAGEELLAPDLVERVAPRDQEPAVSERVPADVRPDRSLLRHDPQCRRLGPARRDPRLEVGDRGAQLLEMADGLLVPGRRGVRGSLCLGHLGTSVVDGGGTGDPVRSRDRARKHRERERAERRHACGGPQATSDHDR